MFFGLSIFGFLDCNMLENIRLNEDLVDDDCLLEKNGDLILVLIGVRFWNRFLEIGIEMIISWKGRYDLNMFVFIKFYENFYLLL